MANHLDKPFKPGDRVITNDLAAQQFIGGKPLPIGARGRIHRIPTERWHNNEVVVDFDNGPVTHISCLCLDLEPAPTKTLLEQLFD